MTLENTAIPGADPGTGGNPSDSPTDDKGQKASDTPTDEQDLGDDGKPLPFDQNPKWKSARQAEKTLNKLLEDNDVESIDDLVELVQSGRKVVGKVDPDSLDEIIDKASTLDRYNEHWNRERELEAEENEDPDERSERLRRENEQLKRERAMRKAAEDNKRALETFEGQIKSGVSEALPDAPAGQVSFIEEFLTIGNPAVDVDITNKVAVNKAIRDGIKKVEKFKQQIIKDYLAGKEKIIDVKPVDAGGITQPGEVKTLKDARKAFLGMFK